MARVKLNVRQQPLMLLRNTAGRYSHVCECGWEGPPELGDVNAIFDAWDHADTHWQGTFVQIEAPHLETVVF